MASGVIKPKVNALDIDRKENPQPRKGQKSHSQENHRKYDIDSYKMEIQTGIFHENHIGDNSSIKNAHCY